MYWREMKEYERSISARVAIISVGLGHTPFKITWNSVL